MTVQQVFVCQYIIPSERPQCLHCSTYSNILHIEVHEGSKGADAKQIHESLSKSLQNLWCIVLNYSHETPGEREREGGREREREGGREREREGGREGERGREGECVCKKGVLEACKEKHTLKLTSVHGVV